MVDQTIAHIAAQNHISVADMQKQIRAEGMNYKQYRNEIRDALMINQVQQHGIAPRIKISEQEITDFLILHGKEMTAAQHAQAAIPGVYHIQVLIIPLQEQATPEQIADAKQAAQKVRAQLNANTNLETFVATKLGVDLNLQQQDLGWRKLTELPELYVKSIQNLQPGAFSGPILTPNGLHILRLVESHGGGALSPTAQGMVETHVRHILIKSNPLLTDDQIKTRMARLRATILAGTPFEQVAAANSQDPGSATKGGDVGWVTVGALDPAFEGVMNQMKVGQISVPFKSQFGWHILQVLDRKTRQTPDVKRDQAKQILLQHKIAVELKHWLQLQRNTGYIKVLIQ